MRKMNKKTFRGKLLSLVLPITFQQLMVTVVSASDALMVGVIGQDLLSAVSLASQVTFVYNLFIAALTIGTSMFAAQYWGKGDKDAVERVLGIVMRTSVPVSAVFFVLTTFAPEALMRIFTSDPALTGHGSDYLRIVGVTYLLCGVSQIYLCIMKNSDLAAKSMIIGSAAALLNIVLNAVLIYGLLGAGRLETARLYGGRLCRISILSGVCSGALLLLLSPLVLAVTDLSPASSGYLKWMLVMCTYYMVGKYVNGTTIAGIFCAGGDSGFGFLCDTITLWCFTVPAGFLAAFVFRLPVLAVYFIINLDEIVKLPAVYRRYRKYIWLKDLTIDTE